MKVELLHYTPIEPLMKATSMPYKSKESKKVVKKVWDSGHRSIARHGMASFLVQDVSQSLLRQLSRHPHINLTVESTRYCDMTGYDVYAPKAIITDKEKYQEYVKDMGMLAQIYAKWKQYEKEENKIDIAKMFLPLATTIDLVVSGNYQALYEFCTLRNCVRVEEEIRELSLKLTNILKEIMPEIFSNLGCKGDELGYCPELYGSCKKYPHRQ